MDTHWCQATGVVMTFPGQPQVRNASARQPELGESGQNQPRPPVGLLGVPYRRCGPSQSLFEKAEGMLQVEAPEVGAPDELQVRVGASQVRSLLGLIAEKKVSGGYKRIQLLRRPLDNDEVEFVTIMWFDSWDAVKEFAGEDYERSYVPAAAREVLARFDERSQHYEIRESLEY